MKEKVKRCWEPLRKTPKEKKSTYYTKVLVIVLFIRAKNEK